MNFILGKALVKYFYRICSMMMAAVDVITNLPFEEDYFNKFMDEGGYYNTL